jgi:hypothetical protein
MDVKTEINIIKSGMEDIRLFRILFLQENNFQFVHDKCHLYGWADTWLFTIGGVNVGYGSIWGKDQRQDRDTIFEFYVIPAWRKFSNRIFFQFYTESGAIYIECQSNDLLLSTAMYEYGQNINAEAILFEDQFQTNFTIPGIIFRVKDKDSSARSDDRQYLLQDTDTVVANGGLMLNYNMPYADIYYEVDENQRRRGFGSLMVQELKKAAYLAGRVPSARCNIKNDISKATLLKSGFTICGYILIASIRQ